jgi:chromosome segregation protein
MRLSTIKLAGFKSFVDPTVLHFPTNLSGVVGPNGCGKSNIIDAIRWVMGESAASRLRGDSLTDVIFSGSSGRKPVGSATVELVFDNADGAISGEYASYAEISVRRTVSRDGNSQYFLNGVRCRRRDITDLFLGTGLGPRSYSIIEQGMISQIIDADPEQLRSHLEEAAGISKYKERRKETEGRIRATRENLDRVRDVRDEVDKQLDHLKRQARAAERWQNFKAEQARKEAELKALNLRVARARLAGHVDSLRAAETEVERRLAEQRRHEAELEQARVRHGQAGEALNAAQAEVYRVGAEVARVEQQIRHTRELAEQLERARAETDRAHSELEAQIAADGTLVTELEEALEAAEPTLATLVEEEERCTLALGDAEARLAAWQEQWDAYAKSGSAATQAAEVERTRIDYLERRSLEADRRRATLEGERSAASVEELEAALGKLTGEHETLRIEVENLTGTVDGHRTRHGQLVADEQSLQAELSARRGQLEAARGRLSSLEALQAAALGDSGENARSWLERAGFESAPHVAESLDVQDGWERAVETVLADWLDGRLVDSSRDAATLLAELAEADMTLIDARAGDGSPPPGTLATVVRGPAAVIGWLGRIRMAANLEEARALVTSLAADESVITRSGEWLAPGFARVRRGQDAGVGVLAREREIHDLALRIAQLEREIAELAERVEQGRSTRAEVEQQRDDAQAKLYRAHRSLADVSGRIESQRGRIDASRERLQRIAEELAQLGDAIEADNEATRAARAELEAAVARMGELERRRHELDGERRALLEAREEARMNAAEARDARHRAALSIESRRAALASSEQALARMRAQLAQLATRKSEIAAELVAGSDPLSGLEAERQACLDQRLVVDRQLVDARKTVEEQEAQLRQFELERHRVVEVLDSQREEVSTLRLAEQEHRLAARALESEITTAGFVVDELLEAVPADADPGERETELVEIGNRIRRLEPVNLAAISEYEEQSQRKDYLDAQLADLGAALETLEGAIRKIDRETRQRFKDTFDKVNAGVQELFPRLFGGGHAYLELTGDDLLTTGVGLMARPPGKRVSSISLLSGGEKALTAVALVFAIFRLNPAPFCLLDEVDAPLDEANVGRFSDLVREMSEHVQFIFVTHNKGTMEAAMQLCGVTMREPGVSRLVQVDLAEATQLAGVA